LLKENSILHPLDVRLEVVEAACEPPLNPVFILFSSFSVNHSIRRFTRPAASGQLSSS
jgi:hypothetical protein